MNRLIYSEELCKLFCTYCHKYLSVQPIKCTSDGILICGRCSNRTDYADLKSSLYNSVARRMVFRCINYYSGCRDLLLIDKVLEHERTCTKLSLQCPLCHYAGNGCSLYVHFTRNHSGNGSSLSIVDGMSKNIIFTKNQSMLFLNVHVGREIVQIFNFLATWFNKDTRFDFELKFYGEEGFLKTPTITVNSSKNKFQFGFDLNTQIAASREDVVVYRVMMDAYFPSGSCICQVLPREKDNEKPTENYFKMLAQKVDASLTVSRVSNLSKGFEFYINSVIGLSSLTVNEILSELYKLQRCVICGCFVTFDVYVCPSYHLACTLCSTKKCRGCKRFSIWNKKSKFDRIALRCYWEACNMIPNFFGYQRHKRDCMFRQYECPDAGCEFKGCAKCLQKHWHVGDFQYGGFYLHIQNNRSIYWLTYNELFHVTSEVINVEISNDYSCLMVKFTAVDVFMMNVYKYELKCPRIDQEIRNMEGIPFTVYDGKKQGREVKFLRADDGYTDDCYLLLTDRTIKY